MFRCSKTCNNTIRNILNIQHKPYSISPILDFRRQHNRRQWKSPSDPDAEFTIFPNISLGNDCNLNWEFNAYQITPSSEAYRNPHFRALQMLAPGKLDKNKVLHINTEEPNDHKIFYLSSDKTENHENCISDDIWKSTIRQVRMEMSFEKQLFMNDSVIGSSRNSSITSRLLFNNPLCALQLYYALPSIPACLPKNFAHRITGWMFETEDLKFSGDKYGINTNNYTLIDLNTKRFIIVGKLTQNVVRKSLLAVIDDYFTSERDSILLNCDAIIEENNTGLVYSIGGPPISSTEKLNVYSAENTIWSPNGLVRTWDSISLDSMPKDVKPGEINETIGKNKRFTRKLENTIGHVAPHPKVLVFVDNNSKKNTKSTITKQKMKEIFQSDSLSGLSSTTKESYYNKLNEFLSSNNTKCYIVGKNTNTISNIKSTFK